MVDYDLLIVNFFHQYSSAQVDLALNIATNVIYAVLLYFLFYFWQKKDKRKLCLLIISGILGFGIATGLKYLVNRPRPYPESDFIDSLIGSKASSSFPSRHSFLAGLGLYFIPNFRKSIKRIFIIYFLLFIPLGLLVMGVHYLTDIISGLALGYAIPLILDKVLKNKI